MGIKKKICILAVFFLLISLLMPLAESKTVRSVKIYGGFIHHAIANEIYTRNFTFKSPEGLDKILYTKAVIKADILSSNTIVYSGSLCSPSYYNIPITGERYEMEFNCGGFTGEGNYTFGFMSTKDIYNVYIEFELIYLSKPIVELENIWKKIKYNLNFLGTEYYPGEKATVWLQLLLDNKPVENGTCFLTAYYPNKTKLLDNVLLNYLYGSDGLYYYDLTAPADLGVYMLSASCELPKKAFVDDFLNYEYIEDYDGITISEGRVVLSSGSKTGYIRSEPLDLSALNWVEFGSDYDLKGGNISFQVLDENNSVICTGLGNISSCAGTTSPIKLYAELTRSSSSVESPVIYRWWVSWKAKTIEEIKGSGEMHVSDTNLLITSVNETIKNKFNELNTTLNNSFTYTNSLITSVNNTINWWGDLLNTTVTEINSTVTDIKNNWGSYTASDIITRLDTINTTVNDIQSKVDCSNPANSYLCTYLDNINSTVNTIYIEMATAEQCSNILSNVTWIRDNVATSEAMNNNFTDVRNRLTNMNTTLVAIHDNLEAVNSSLSDQITGVQNDITWIKDNVATSSEIQSNFTETFSRLTEINSTISDINDYLLNDITNRLTEINTTTQESYTKLIDIGSNVTSVNETVKNKFGELNTALYNNFTYTNSLITSVNNTINWWGDLLNTTIASVNETVNWWGDFLNTTINFWGNKLEQKIDDIIMGNVTVTAVVDYDEIATTVVQYFKALGLDFFRS